VKVFIKGQGAISLSKNDFVASGGEGSVYAKGSTAFKLYTDPHKMIPVGKIQELSAITDPHIIKPEHVVTDTKGTPVGYTMRYARGTYALCQLFPRAFRERNKITPEQMLGLVQKLRDGVEHIHQARVLIVDLNEMNHLVDKQFQELFFIDVDSYQTPHYPATAIMESIRDRHMAPGDFTTLTDWFSFGIVAFQMFVGIHPYKGKHPTLKGFEARMQANVSVFDPKVKLPKVVYPFDVIPGIYKSWFKAVFQEGKRLPPPADLSGAVIVIPTVRQISGTLNLDISSLAAFAGDIRGMWESFGSFVVLAQGVHMDGRKVGPGDALLTVGFTPLNNKPVAVYEQPEGIPRLVDLATGQHIEFGLHADQAMSTNGRIYLKSRDKVMEVVLTEAGNKVIASTKLAANVLPKASWLFEGGVVQDLLGSAYVSLFPSPGKAFQVHLKELDKYKILSIRFCPSDKGGGILMVVASHKGQYDRFIYRFDPWDYDYDLRKIEDITPAGLNFVVLDSGVCVSLTEDDKLELFSVRKGSTQVKVIDDQMLGGDMILGKRGGQVVFSRGNKVYKMRMR